MKQSFQKKIFMSVAAFMTALILICISVFSFYTYRNLYKQSLTSLQYISEKTASELEVLLESMDNLALYASTDLEVRSAFTLAKSPHFSDTNLSKKTASALTQILIPNNMARYRISLYNQKGNFISLGIPYSKAYTSAKLSSDKFAEWYQALPVIHNSASFYGFHPDYWSDRNDSYLSLFREIFGTVGDSGSTANANAVIEIQCPFSFIDKILGFKESNYYSSYLYNADGSLIYPVKNPPVSQDTIQKAYTEKSTGYLSESKLFYSGYPVRNGFYLVLTQSEKHIWSIIFPQILSVLFVGTVSLIILVILLFYITRRATRPLQELTASVKQVSYSNLSLELDFSDYPDEMVGLNKAFDKMFQRLRQSIDEVVRMQACEARANMVALQSQMDPHFLYNTLTVIKALSREHNYDQIGLTCDYLVKMLRYISSYDEHSTSLKQELTHTENYLNLMKIRYEDQFTYSFTIDSGINTDSLRLPRLTLQPLLENCFQHGFKTVAPPGKPLFMFGQSLRTGLSASRITAPE